MSLVVHVLTPLEKVQLADCGMQSQNTDSLQPMRIRQYGQSKIDLSAFKSSTQTDLAPNRSRKKIGNIAVK